MLSQKSWFPCIISLLKSKIITLSPRRSKKQNFAEKGFIFQDKKFPFTAIPWEDKFTESSYRTYEECHFQRGEFDLIHVHGQLATQCWCISKMLYSKQVPLMSSRTRSSVCTENVYTRVPKDNSHLVTPQFLSIWCKQKNSLFISHLLISSSTQVRYLIENLRKIYQKNF